MLAFDRFTEGAQNAASRAYEILQRYGHGQVDTEHLLLALLEQPEGAIAGGRAVPSDIGHDDRNHGEIAGADAGDDASQKDQQISQRLLVRPRERLQALDLLFDFQQLLLRLADVGPGGGAG